MGDCESRTRSSFLYFFVPGVHKLGLSGDTYGDGDGKLSSSSEGGGREGTDSSSEVTSVCKLETSESWGMGFKGDCE